MRYPEDPPTVFIWSGAGLVLRLAWQYSCRHRGYWLSYFQIHDRVLISGSLTDVVRSSRHKGGGRIAVQLDFSGNQKGDSVWSRHMGQAGALLWTQATLEPCWNMDEEAWLCCGGGAAYVGSNHRSAEVAPR